MVVPLRGKSTSSWAGEEAGAGEEVGCSHTAFTIFPEVCPVEALVFKMTLLRRNGSSCGVCVCVCVCVCVIFHWLQWNISSLLCSVIWRVQPLQSVMVLHPVCVIHPHTHTCHTYTSYLSQFKVNTETERDVNERFQYHQELVKQSAIFFIFRNNYQK